MLDIQLQLPKFQTEIDQVGISDFLIPIKVVSNFNVLHTIASFSFSANLAKEEKGTHMSRLILILHKFQDQIFDYDTLLKISNEAKVWLKASCSFLSFDFDYFVKKQSPVTKIDNLVNYKASLRVKNNHATRIFIKVKVPITAVCPCSKEISDDGAHNQRGIVTIEAEITGKKGIWLDQLIKIAELSGSSELYSVLKREDEKFVTEKAYENAVFVEDIVRAVDDGLTKLSLENYSVICKNYESIHNHNAFAKIIKGDICI